MNKIITAACIIAVCFFSACAEKQPDYDPGLEPVNSSKTNSAAASGSQNTLTNNEARLPTTAPATITPLSPEATKQITATTATGMNPPHGQPGHRCDIAVGAPLNSAPTKPVTQTVQTITPTATPTAKTITVPGMNPPHGEPGHRCDIAVGAPLNSPATKPAATPAQTITPVMSPAQKDSGS